MLSLQRFCALFALICALAISSFAQTQTATIIAARVNLRGTANAKGRVVQEVKQGEKVEILLSRGPWYLVQTADYVGWLHGNAIRLDDEQAAESKTLPQEPPPRANNTPARRGSKQSVVAPSGSASRAYTLGPRGGCYYLNSSGRKVYVDHSLCQ